MVKSMQEKMNEFRKIPVEVLGPYEAKADNLTTTLTLKAYLNFVGWNDPGYDLYEINAQFSKPSRTQLIDEPIAVNYNFGSGGNLKEVIQRLKLNEAGIERMLDTRDGDGWESNRNVMACLIDLEKQIAGVQKERAEATERRKNYLDGKRDSF